jgi:hypothetical protein
MRDDDPRVKELRDLAYRLSNVCNKPGSRVPPDVQRKGRNLSSKVQGYCSDVEYIAEADFVERKAQFEKLLNAEVAKVKKAEEEATEDSKSKCYRGLGGGSYEVAYLTKSGGTAIENAPLNTSTSKRAQALTAEEVAARCRDDPEALFLCDVGIGDTDIDALCKGLKTAGKTLTTLDISNNQIADAGVQTLVTAFATGMCPQLTELYIGCNTFGEQGLTMLNGGLGVLRKGLAIHAEDAPGHSTAQELGEPSAPKLEVASTEQEASLGDVESPASQKQKSPTGGDTGSPLDGGNLQEADARPETATAAEAGSAFSGSCTIVDGADDQEVHVVVPLAGSAVTSAADLDLDVSASEVRISGPGGLTLSVSLPAEVDPGSAQPSFSKKRQRLVVKLKVR